MARNYTPKTSYLSLTRVQKIAKDLINESRQDRELALEAHRYFKQRLEDDPEDFNARGLMVETLKVAQTSKTGATKILQLAIKLLEYSDGKKGTSKGASATSTEELDFSVLAELDAQENSE